MTLAIVSTIFSSVLADFGGPLCVRLTRALAHFSWQGCLIGALYYFVNLALRKNTANSRYIAGLAAMALLAVCPPVTFALFSSGNLTHITQSEVFREPSTSHNQLASNEIKPSLPLNAQESEIRSITPPFEAFMRQDSIRKWTRSDFRNQLIERVSPYVMAVYLMVSLALLCRVGVGYSVVWKFKADSIEIVNDRLQLFVERLCEQWAMSVVPVVASCQQVAAPVVIGVLRPMILLPPCLMTGCDVDQLEALLAHELAHIRRWDLLVNLTQRVVEALLFFHPAVWYVSRRISIEREHACDDLVISTGWRPLDYCRALIGLAEACAMPRQPLVVAPISISAFGRGSSDFRQRILRLAGESAESKPQLTRSGFSGLAAVLGILILVSIAFRSHRDSKTESPKVIDSRDIARRDSIVDATPLVNAEGTDAAGESDFVMNELLVDVLIEGNSTIQSSEIAKHIKASIGDKVTSKLVKDDVDALVRTRWFSSVEPTLRKTDVGVVLAFRVLERPIVRRVEYKGLKKIKRKVFDAMTQLKPGTPFDVSSNQECARRIEEYYREKGFLFATVELEKGDDRNDRDVVFSINEGPKVHVSTLRFNGAVMTDSAIIDATPISKTPIMTLATSADYDFNDVANDTEQFRRYFHRFGYFDVDVSHEMKTPKGRSTPIIRYLITQGVRYKIRHVEFIGNLMVPASEIRNVLKVTDGAFYNATEIDRDVDAITSVFDQRGHLLAHIEPVPRWSEEPGVIDLVYQISPCIEAEDLISRDLW